MARTSATAKKTSSNSKSNASTARSRQPANVNQQGRASSSQSDQTLLRTLFVDSIKDIYWAEKHLIKVLPRLGKAATSEELQAAFDDHLAVTQSQVERLEEVFNQLGIAPRGKKCDAMEGLAQEAQSIIDDTPDGTATRDVGLIMAAQKVEHYEIATYGSLAQLARTLGEETVADIFEGILNEEKEADVLLTEIAENDVNYQAEEEDEEDE